MNHTHATSQLTLCFMIGTSLGAGGTIKNPEPIAGASYFVYDTQGKYGNDDSSNWQEVSFYTAQGVCISKKTRQSLKGISPYELLDPQAEAPEPACTVFYTPPKRKRIAAFLKRIHLTKSQKTGQQPQEVYKDRNGNIISNASHAT